MNITLLTFDLIDSTNTEALKQARLGADEGVCIIAREQTAGRGRHGREWVSEKDAGLYFSIILRPRFETRDLPLITLAAGVAVHDTLVELGLKPDIKWVNDILVGEKKISGILAETTETDKGLAIVVGIGINIRSSNFPPEIADTATSIEKESNLRVTAGGLSETLSKYLRYYYELLSDGDGPRRMIDEWSKRSTYFSGKRVRVNLDGSSIEGTTDGLEPNGALRLRTSDGAMTIVQAGDVERLRAAD